MLSSTPFAPFYKHSHGQYGLPLFHLCVQLGHSLLSFFTRQAVGVCRSDEVLFLEPLVQPTEVQVVDSDPSLDQFVGRLDSNIYIYIYTYISILEICAHPKRAIKNKYVQTCIKNKVWT